MFAVLTYVEWSQDVLHVIHVDVTCISTCSLSQALNIACVRIWVSKQREHYTRTLKKFPSNVLIEYLAYIPSTPFLSLVFLT